MRGRFSTRLYTGQRHVGNHSLYTHVSYTCLEVADVNKWNDITRKFLEKLSVALITCIHESKISLNIELWLILYTGIWFDKNRILSNTFGTLDYQRIPDASFCDLLLVMNWFTILFCFLLNGFRRPTPIRRTSGVASRRSTSPRQSTSLVSVRTLQSSDPPFRSYCR